MVDYHVTVPLALPHFPAGEPKDLDRRQGVFYAQRVLKQLDHEIPELPERAKGLRWAVEEMEGVRDAVAHQQRHSDAENATGAAFFAGILGALASAELGLKQQLARVGELRTQAEQYRARAAYEHARLSGMATRAETSAVRESLYQTADKRFL